MSFSSYTIIVTYFMAALGLWAVSLVESIDAVFVATASGFVLLTLFLNVRKKEVVPGYLWNVLAAVVFALFAADYFLFSKSLITAGSRFLTVLMILRLFDLKKNRDYFLAYSIAFFQILAAAASTISPVFFLILTLFVIASIFAMVVFTIKRDMAETGSSHTVPRNFFGLTFFTSVIVISTASMTMTFLLFFIMPRMGIGFFERKTLNTLKVSGFSDKVEMGTIGPVKTDPTVIMRVEIKGAKPRQTLYFRGASLERYDGTSWTKGMKNERLFRKSGSAINIRDARGNFIEQEILLEPLDTEYIFAASQPVTVEGRFPNLWVDASGAMRLPAPPYSRISYRAVSSPMELNEPAPPEYLDASYIEESGFAENIRGLADSITGGIKTEAGKAAAIEGYLEANYRYTLDPKHTQGVAPLEDFLFHSKEGYCEHYATAMVMLLRASGIPARLVTGFLEGEWNGLGNYYIVRQQDAHSWVEAHVGGAWKVFDPTPPSLAPINKPTALTLYLDLMRLKWNRYVINYSFADQRKIATEMEGRTRGLFGDLKAASKAVKEKGVPYLLPAFAAALALVFLSSLAARKIREKKTSPKAPAFYLELLKILGKKGYLRKMDETPSEFAERTGLPGAMEVTRAFESARYGGKRLSPEDSGRIKETIDRLRKMG